MQMGFDMTNYQNQNFQNFSPGNFNMGIPQLDPYGNSQMMQMGSPNGAPPGMNQSGQMIESGQKKKPIILEQTNNRYTGKLKFFDETKGYGFIIMDNDSSDIFCHYDDFFKAGIDLDMLKKAKIGQDIKLSFQCLSYIGRHNKSRKAVDLIHISE